MSTEIKSTTFIDPDSYKSIFRLECRIRDKMYSGTCSDMDVEGIIALLKSLANNIEQDFV